MDIHFNADTGRGSEQMSRMLMYVSNPRNQDTPLISTLWVDPKGVRTRGVALYDLFGSLYFAVVQLS